MVLAPDLPCGLHGTLGALCCTFTQGLCMSGLPGVSHALPFARTFHWRAESAPRGKHAQPTQASAVPGHVHCIKYGQYMGSMKASTDNVSHCILYNTRARARVCLCVRGALSTACGLAYVHTTGTAREFAWRTGGSTHANVVHWRYIYSTVDGTVRHTGYVSYGTWAVHTLHVSPPLSALGLPPPSPTKKKRDGRADGGMARTRDGPGMDAACRPPGMAQVAPTQMPPTGDASHLGCLPPAGGAQPDGREMDADGRDATRTGSRGRWSQMDPDSPPLATCPLNSALTSSLHGTNLKAPPSASAASNAARAVHTVLSVARGNPARPFTTGTRQHFFKYLLSSTSIVSFDTPAPRCLICACCTM